MRNHIHSNSVSDVPCQTEKQFHMPEGYTVSATVTDLSIGKGNVSCGTGVCRGSDRNVNQRRTAARSQPFVSERFSHAFIQFDTAEIEGKIVTALFPCAGRRATQVH